MRSTVELDNLDVKGKRTLVIVTAILMIVLSHVSYVLRLLAKRQTVARIQAEDWLMGLALLFSYGSLVCQFYVGLGEHSVNVSKENEKRLSLSIWLIQRFQPFCLLCLKSSIILLYVRLFPTDTFRRFAWGIWVYTLLWTIGALGASTFECTPVSYFWNKDQEGHCVPNALRTVSFTNGFLSFIGDCVILCMPLPMIWNLRMNMRKKFALLGIFTVGVFVIITSIIRLIALFSIDSKDLSFTQVEGGVWTYMEEGIGITCGNLPLLQPLFKHYFSSHTSHSHSHSEHNSPNYYVQSSITAKSSRPPSRKKARPGSYTRMSEELILDGKDGIEMQPPSRRASEQDRDSDRERIVIVVKTDVTVKKELGDPHQRFMLKRDTIDPLRRPPTKAHVAAEASWLV
ncbi:integral membrane protein [Rutstroemia sp. NJR-2017a WRK4]|nr:integral membrane protein [Rutstroemia sp. NJR-2017a WRK4]